jgi:hypothetical protein
MAIGIDKPLGFRLSLWQWRMQEEHIKTFMHARRLLCDSLLLLASFRTSKLFGQAVRSLLRTQDCKENCNARKKGKRSAELATLYNNYNAVRTYYPRTLSLKAFETASELYQNSTVIPVSPKTSKLHKNTTNKSLKIHRITS